MDKINWGFAIANFMIGVDVLASIAYFIQKDVRHGIYWLAAAVLTAAVTY